MDQVVQVLALALAGIVAPAIFQVIKTLGGWSELKAMLLAYAFALALGGIVAFLTGLVQVTWPPVEPNLLVTQLLAVFGVVNTIAQIVYREWMKRATPETGPPPETVVSG